MESKGRQPLREYLKPNVKNILWIYYKKNDISDLDNELQSQILIKYLQEECH